MSENRNTYTAKYNRDNYKGISFRLNVNTEADIIEWLSSRDTKAYFIELIRRDMVTCRRRENKFKRINQLKQDFAEALKDETV